MQTFEFLVQKIRSEKGENKFTPNQDLDEWMKSNAPSGSGIDCGTKVDWQKSGGERLVLNTQFHHMDDNGYYCGWTSHQVVVTPTLWCGPINVRITGRDRRDIKSYLHELYSDWLTQEVVYDQETKLWELASYKALREHYAKEKEKMAQLLADEKALSYVPPPVPNTEDCDEHCGPACIHTKEEINNGDEA